MTLGVATIPSLGGKLSLVRPCQFQKSSTCLKGAPHKSMLDYVYVTQMALATYVEAT
jgi:hypothetical protein